MKHTAEAKNLIGRYLITIGVIFASLLHFGSVTLKAQSNAIFKPEYYRSVVILDEESLSQLDFSSAIDSILTDYPDTTRKEFVSKLLDTFAEKSGINGSVKMPIFSLAEKNVLSTAGLTAKNLLNPTHRYGLVPSAVFNRMDLAPYSFDDCGEFRIVYSFKKAVAGSVQRLFFIFESRPLTPKAPSGKSTFFDQEMVCQDVAKFWTDLGLEDSANERSEKLRKFFFQGNYGSSTMFTPPVISAEYLGVSKGQIRGNIKATLYNDSTPPMKELGWQLREWKTSLDKSSPTKLTIATASLKKSPYYKLYEDIKGSDQNLKKLKEDFRLFFKTELAKVLINPNQKGIKNSNFWYVNNLGTPPPKTQFPEKIILNEYQNITSPPNWLNPIEENTSTQFLKLAGEVINENKPINQKLNRMQLLNRARVLSCGGCHHPNGIEDLGEIKRNGGVIITQFKWPESLRFTHVNEIKTSEINRLSDALRNFFLPFRRAKLREFVTKKISKVQGSQRESTLAKEYSELLASLNSLRQLTENEKFGVQLERIKKKAKELKIKSASEDGAFVKFRRTH